MDLTVVIIGMVGSLASITALWVIVQNNITATSLNRSERFKNAVEQLGSGKNPVVLGAVYSLHRIAREDESYRENVFNILCAYVRDHSSEAEYQQKHAAKPSEPVQAVLNLLSVNPKDADVYTRLSNSPLGRLWQGWLKEDVNKFSIDFSEAFLNGAYLEAAHLEGADLQKAHLEKAYLGYARLEQANLGYAHLKEAILWRAHLEKTNLGHGSLESANLEQAHLAGANLEQAHLQRGNLRNATLENADLRFAHLEGANLDDALAEGAVLWQAHLEEASLVRANLQGANLIGAHLEGSNLVQANLGETILIGAHLEGASLIEAILEGANLDEALLEGAYSSSGWLGSFEERLFSRMGEKTDLSGIAGGYDASAPPFKGTPIMGVLPQEKAEEIIADYKKRMGQ